MKKKMFAILMSVALGAALFTGCGAAENAAESAASEAASAVSEAADAAEEAVSEAADAAEEAVSEAADAAEEAVSEAAEAASDAAEAVSEAAEDAEAPADTAEGEAAASDQELLVVSFGTTFDNSRTITIGGIENALREAYPNFKVRRAFTADLVIERIEEASGVKIDNVTEALDRAVEDGIKTLVVQPTHLMSGFEYTDLSEALKEYEDKIDTIVLSDPLLTDDSDFEAVANAIVDKTASYDDGETAIVFMGHGTEAESNGVYAKMQETLTGLGKENYYIGTVEAEPSLEDVMAAIDGKGYKKVVLSPLMVVAGDHANNDMAGDEEDSWKTQLEAAGYEVTCVLEGLGQNYDIQSLYVKHAAAAIEAAGASVDKNVAVDTVSEVNSDKAILAVSFGTTFDNSRNITIGGIENALRESFPEYQVRRAFTADLVIERIAEASGVKIDNVTEALDRAVEDGIKELIVQPTHLMNGFEYTDLRDALENYTDKFDKLVLSDPLLTDDSDFEAVANAIVDRTASYDDGETAIVFMGHGTEAESNGVYAKMQETLAGLDKANYYIGTVEAEPSLEDVMAAIDGKGYKRVVLRPLMVVAGDHANNDMAGDEEDSWKTVLEGAGYEVVPVLQGLGQVSEIQQIYVAHAKAAIEA